MSSEHCDFEIHSYNLVFRKLKFSCFCGLCALIFKRTVVDIQYTLDLQMKPFCKFLSIGSSKQIMNLSLHLTKIYFKKYHDTFI